MSRLHFAKIFFINIRNRIKFLYPGPKRDRIEFQKKLLVLKKPTALVVPLHVRRL